MVLTIHGMLLNECRDGSVFFSLELICSAIKLFKDGLLETYAKRVVSGKHSDASALRDDGEARTVTRNKTINL